MNMAIIMEELLSTVDNRHCLCALFVILFQHFFFGLIDLANVFPDFSSYVYGTILLSSRLIEHIFTLRGFPYVEYLFNFWTTCIKTILVMGLILYEAARDALDDGPSELIVVEYLGLLLGKLIYVLLETLKFVFTFL